MVTEAKSAANSPGPRRVSAEARFEPGIAGYRSNVMEKMKKVKKVKKNLTNMTNMVKYKKKRGYYKKLKWKIVIGFIPKAGV
jgi:hypothetical protein